MSKYAELNLSRERISFIRSQIEFGARIDPKAAKDLLAHNDHLVELSEARARLLLSADIAIDRLTTENESLRKDAERYRWLRRECESHDSRITIAEAQGFGLVGWSGDDPDGEIDAAMSNGDKP